MTDEPGERPTFPRALAFEVFTELARRFDPQPAWEWDGGDAKPRSCPHALASRLCAVGGFRRGKAHMKDLELLFIPRVKCEADPGDFFGAQREVDVTELLIERMVAEGVIEPRLSVKGFRTWGRWNKLARHVATGLPVDLFCATAENYFNRLVVTTGPRELNVRIASKAREIGWEWEVNSAGFVPLGKTWDTAERERRTMRSEADVFKFVDFPFLPPAERK